MTCDKQPSHRAHAQELKELSRAKEEDVKLEANDADIHRWKARLRVRARSPPVLLTDTFLSCLISASIQLSHLCRVQHRPPMKEVSLS